MSHILLLILPLNSAKKQIVKLIPKHTIYVEPFIGAGSVFLRKPPSEKEVINDLDKDIANMWRDMKKVGELAKTFTFHGSVKEFKKQLTNNTRDPAKRLYRNLYLSKFSFGGGRKTPISKEGYKERNKQDVGVHLKTNADKYKDRLKKVTIKRKDWKSIVQQYDSAQTFFYLDPPYETEKEKSTWQLHQ